MTTRGGERGRASVWKGGLVGPGGVQGFGRLERMRSMLADSGWAEAALRPA